MTSGLRVISLFDGMSCGRIALTQMGVPLESYDCWEIDRHASQVAQHNFPDNVNHGDVFEADFTEYKGADLLIGGSPCTYWSIAQSSDRRETTASGLGWELFSQYVRALREAEPRVFLYENNKSMSKEIRASITETFGFEPIHINSALVSAQKRDRLYWVGIRNDDGTYRRADVTQPEDRGILLKDVLDSTVYCLRMVRTEEGKELRRAYENHEIHHGFNEHRRPDVREDGKSNTVTTVTKDNMVIEPVDPLSDSQMEYMLRETTKGRNHFDFGHVFDTTREKAPCVTTGANRIPYNVVVEPIGDAKGISMTGTFGERRVGVSEKACLAANPSSDMSARCIEEVGGSQCWVLPNEEGEQKEHQSTNVYTVDGKSVCLNANGGGGGAKTGLYAIPEFEYTEIKVREGYELRVNDRNIQCRSIEKDTLAQESVITLPDATTNALTVAHVPKTITPSEEHPVGCWEDGKSHCLMAGYYKACDRDIVGNPYDLRPGVAVMVTDPDDHPVYEVKDGKITFKGREYPIRLPDGRYRIRKLTVSECKRLQTIPDWYDMTCISKSQAYKCLGNGWTVEVITHLLGCAGVKGVSA